MVKDPVTRMQTILLSQGRCNVVVRWAICRLSSSPTYVFQLWPSPQPVPLPSRHEYVVAAPPPCRPLSFWGWFLLFIPFSICCPAFQFFLRKTWTASPSSSGPGAESYVEEIAFLSLSNNFSLLLGLAGNMFDVSCALFILASNGSS